jgi:cytoskeleton protein RodZ
MNQEQFEENKVGQELAFAREAKGMSQEQIADILNLTLANVIALENDDYESLPGWTYVSGYLRAYARLLDLDSDSLRDKAEALIQGDVESLRQFDGSKNESPTSVSKLVWYKKLLHKGTLTPIAAASALFLFFFALDAVLDSAERSSVEISSGSEFDSTVLALETARTGSDSNDPKVEVPSIQGPIEDALLDKAAPGVGDQTKDELNNQSLYEEISDNTIISETPQIAQEPSAKTDEKPEVIDEALQEAEDQEVEGIISVIAAEATEDLVQEGAEQNFAVEFLGFNEWGERVLSSVGEDRMRIDFQEDCWVEIRSNDERLLYADLGKAGEVKDFVGQSPWLLKLGYADGISIYFNGSPVKLVPAPEGRITRFTVDEDKIES